MVPGGSSAPVSAQAAGTGGNGEQIAVALDARTCTGDVTTVTSARSTARTNRFADGASQMRATNNTPLITARWTVHAGQLLILALGTYLVVVPHSKIAAGLFLGFGTGVALSGSI